MSAAIEIRQALRDPRQLCDALGLARGGQRQSGGGITILCPLHKEKSPSCSITLGDDGTIRFRCFGCQATGDALTLIAAVHGLDVATQFDQVLEQGAAIAGGVVLPERTAEEREPEPEAISPASYNAIAQALLELCPLDSDSDVLAYCDRRILIVQAARAQCGALPRPELQAVTIARLLDTFSEESLELAGLLWRNDAGKLNRTTFAFPHNRLIITWRQLDGSIASLQRRRVDDDARRKYVFPRGARPPLPFGAEQLRAHDAGRLLVLVEGALDVLALRLLDWRDHLGILPLGLPGLDGWQTSWARFAKGRHVRIGFDADDAGERKVQVIADELYAAGAANVERWTPATGKDWCDVVESQMRPRTERAQ